MTTTVGLTFKRYLSIKRCLGFGRKFSAVKSEVNRIANLRQLASPFALPRLRCLELTASDAEADAVPDALLDELSEALSPVTFEAVSQAAKRNATAERARVLKHLYAPNMFTGKPDGFYSRYQVTKTNTERCAVTTFIKRTHLVSRTLQPTPFSLLNSKTTRMKPKNYL